MNEHDSRGTPAQERKVFSFDKKETIGLGNLANGNKGSIENDEHQTREGEDISIVAPPPDIWDGPRDTTSDAIKQPDLVSVALIDAIPTSSNTNRCSPTDSIEWMGEIKAKEPQSNIYPPDFTSFAEDDLSTLMKYTLYNNIVSIPELGTFKRKKHFSSIASTQLIEKMLAEGTLLTSEITADSVERAKEYPLTAANLTTFTAQRHPFIVPNDHSIPTAYHFPGPSKPANIFKAHPQEEERRSRLYESLVRAQRRYAEKLCIPTGKDYRFTKEEWDSLGENLKIEDWEGGFLIEEPDHKPISSKYAFKKENVASWKGKEKAVEMETDDEDDTTTLMMVF